MSNPHEKAGFDDTEPQAVWILVFAIAIIVTLVATMLFVTAYYDQTHDKLVYERQQLPINQDLRTLQAKEDNELHSYGYADKKAGVVRVPVERAMELVLADATDGKPKYPTTPYQVKKEEPVGQAAPGAPGAKPAAGAPATATPGGHTVAPAPAAHK